MNDAHLNAAVLGVATGIRSTSALGLLARLHASRGGGPLASGPVLALTGCVMAAESFADKLERVPARTEPLPLAGRALLGGAAAAIGSPRSGRAARVGAAAIGATCALAAAWAATALRSAAAARGIPDLLPALAEDMAIAGLVAAVPDLLRR